MLSKGVALVTGASQGLGRSIAIRLAHDGFKVAVNDLPRGREKLEKLTKDIIARGGTASIALADVSSESEVKAMTEGVVKDLGGLDVVSNRNTWRSVLCH